MKRRHLLKSLSFFALAGTSIAHAQDYTDAAILFDRAAVKHKRELRDLIASRGGKLIDLRNASSQEFAKVLGTKPDIDRYSTEGAAYLDKSAILFYSYENIFSPGEGELQVWLIDEHGIQAYYKQSVSEKQISNAILKVRNSLGVDSLRRSRIPREKASIKAVEKLANVGGSLNRFVDELTQLLLPPVIADKLSTVKHLIVVPVLGIGTVPYAILEPFKDGSLLIDKMSISIAPSLFDIGTNLNQWDSESAFSLPLIVGNPYFPENTEWSFPSLPGAEQEAKAVAKMMNATPLIGNEATKAKVLSKVEKSSLLYFATHGVASSRNPLSGGFLMLSAQTLDEGQWTAKEIQNTRLTANIAILSACQTGLGKVHDAGIIGLARAFQLAGVPRVVMSLWSVDDQATDRLMQTFVKNLERYMPSEALRQSMLQVRKEYPEPSKWASFLLFGTPR